MRVSEVFQVQFPLVGFVSVDSEVTTQSRTTHSRNRQIVQKLNNLHVI